MKKIICVMVFVTSFSTFACIELGSNQVCAGDLVYKGYSYPQGAKIINFNLDLKTVEVRSVSNPEIQTTEKLKDLDIPSGCIGEVCVGDKVFKRAIYVQGATVIAVNEDKKKVLVRSNQNTKHLELENPRFLAATSGCVDNVCVGDLVFKGSSYEMGAAVVGINKKDKTVLVRSTYNQYILNTEYPADLDN